jgi:hypothetical protein
LMPQQPSVRSRSSSLSAIAKLEELLLQGDDTQTAGLHTARPQASLENHPATETGDDFIALGPDIVLSDAIAFPINQGLQSATIDLEFGAGVVVVRFTKPRKSFKPVH